jgi:AraC-like DNA-binding protein
MQLSPGALRCANVAVDLDRVRCRRTIYNVSFREGIGAGNHTLTLAYMPRQYGPARIDGHLWLHQRLAVVYGATEFSTSGPVILEKMTVDVDRFPIFDALIGENKIDRAWMALLPADSIAARRLEHEMAAAIESPPSGRSDAQALQSLVASIFRACELAIAPEHWHALDADRSAVVHAAQTYMWSNLCGDIGLPAVSNGIGCSPRTLSNYYLSLYGMSPVRYMKTLRLNRVRELLQRPHNGKSIVDIAADHGFWHMGHFAEHYRYLFGETASETVRNARESVKVS